jgi:hypothetical protein
MFLQVAASVHDDANRRLRLLIGITPTTAGTAGKNPVPLRRKTC